uniref:Fc receptor-like protein 1 n=1 Tax=Pristiophorus japonicus TaxID=55135 RepID=UPI00398EF37B
MLFFAMFVFADVVGSLQAGIAGGSSKLTLTLEPPSGFVMAGDMVRFTCTAPGPQTALTFHLYKVGKQHVINTLEKVFEGVFQFKVMNYLDGGSYFCVYDTERFASVGYSNDVRVIVRAPAPVPTLAVTPSSGGAAIGDTVRFTCTAPGPDPPTHFVLYKDTKNPRLTQAAENSSVTFFELKRVTISDSGSYFCGYWSNQSVSLYSDHVQVTVTGLVWPTAVGFRLGVVFLLHLVVVSVWCWRLGDVDG